MYRVKTYFSLLLHSSVQFADKFQKGNTIGQNLFSLRLPFCSLLCEYIFERSLSFVYISKSLPREIKLRSIRIIETFPNSIYTGYTTQIKGKRSLSYLLFDMSTNNYKFTFDLILNSEFLLNFLINSINISNTITSHVSSLIQSYIVPQDFRTIKRNSITLKNNLTQLEKLTSDIR